MMRIPTYRANGSDRAPSHLTERATHAHPLHPAALASVPYGIVLVRVRVRVRERLVGHVERLGCGSPEEITELAVETR